MGKVNVVIMDTTGSKEQKASLPDDAPVRRIIAKLVQMMALPVTGPGRPAAELQVPPQGLRQAAHRRTDAGRGRRSRTATSCACSRRSPRDDRGAAGVASRAPCAVTGGGPTCLSEQDELQVELAEDRYDRLRLIPWWDQERLRAGPSARGRAPARSATRSSRTWRLLGVGRILIADLDTIEDSNLTRAILFRAQDRGRCKAEVAAERVMEVNPDVRAQATRGRHQLRPRPRRLPRDGPRLRRPGQPRGPGHHQRQLLEAGTSRGLTAPSS